MTEIRQPQDDTTLYRTCVYPFVLFLLFNLLQAIAESALQWEHPDAAWWQRAPEMWLYPLQTLVCAAYLWHVRRGIRWDGTPGTCLLGALLGLVGIGAWLVPYAAGWVQAEGGFQPELIFGVGNIAVPLEYALRFARAVIVVPLVEELFWRGFLQRWCINRDFPQEVPIGSHSWFAYAGTTAGFMLIHVAADYPGAFVYGTLTYALVVRTRRLMPAVVMHAVANLVMGICAIGCDLPHLW